MIIDKLRRLFRRAGKQKKSADKSRYNIDMPKDNNGYTVTDKTLYYKSGITKVERLFDLPPEQSERIERIVVPDTVTEIGLAAFIDMNSLKDIVIPDGVKVIGNLAFKGTNVEQIVIPDSVESIGECAFSGCSNLKSVQLSNNLTRISEKLFFENKSLETIILPGSLKSVGFEAFGKCSKLKSIEIPDSVEEIREYTFFDCISLEAVKLPKGLTEIPNSMFEKCEALSRIDFPESCKGIGFKAFRECSGLKTILIPDTVTRIDMEAFTLCTGLESVKLPKSLEVIREGLFKGCYSLQQVDLPNRLNKIEEDAFSQCHSLESLYLPESLLYISPMTFNNRPKNKDFVFRFDYKSNPNLKYEGDILSIENGILSLSYNKLWQSLMPQMDGMYKELAAQSYSSGLIADFAEITCRAAPENKMHYAFKTECHVNVDKFPALSVTIEKNGGAKKELHFNIADIYYLTSRHVWEADHYYLKWIDILANKDDLSAKQLYLELIQNKKKEVEDVAERRFEL